MEIKVRGLAEVEKQLQELGSKTGTRILRASMLTAAKPIQEAAKRNAEAIQKGSGALHRSIGSRFLSGLKQVGELSLPNMGGRFSVQISPIRKDRVATALHNLFYRRKRKGIFYGHFLEFGFRKRGGNGEVSARPFLGPALRSAGTTSVALLARELQDRIARQLKKNAKK